MGLNVLHAISLRCDRNSLGFFPFLAFCYIIALYTIYFHVGQQFAHHFCLSGFLVPVQSFLLTKRK